MKVELLDVFGSDLTVTNAARVSYGKTKDKLDDKDEKLINFLVKHKHTSPFRHPQLSFRLSVPIFVERQLFKHQVGWAANCLHGDSKIRFKNTSGSIHDVSIKELYNQFTNGRPHQNSIKDKLYVQKRLCNKKMRVLNEQSGEFELSSLKNIVYSGKKKLYKITLQDGKHIICTDQHKIYTQKGWKTLITGLTTADFVGINGLKYAGTGEYQDYNILKSYRDKGLSVSELAKTFDCSYHTIRKWLKIHNLKFNQEDTYFKKGFKPWNIGLSGYKLNLSEEMRKYKSEISKKYNLKGELSHLWKGGITKERDLISVWTTKKSNLVHKKYNYTCQNCYKGHNKLHAHHIIPVTTDITKVYLFDNLITVCQPCHSKIHFNNKTEIQFMQKVTHKDYQPQYKVWGINKKKSGGNKLKIHFSKIQSIEYVGEDDTYDIEMKAPHHNFIANGIVVHNSISGRYVDFSDKYYLIEQFRLQSKDSKQGSSDNLSNESNKIAQEIYTTMIDVCANGYKKLIELGVAKEQARAVLPLALETQFIWTGSLQAFLHLCSLRLKNDTQKETREVVSHMLQLVKDSNKFNLTLKAFEIV